MSMLKNIGYTHKVSQEVQRSTGYQEGTFFVSDVIKLMIYMHIIRSYVELLVAS